MDARIGSEFAGYRIESVLGRGGMGVVYLAEHVRLKRKAALKVLPAELAQDERFRDRFIHESELAASLDHPNIVDIYDAGESDGLLYLAMRFVSGRDLKTLIKREGALDPERAVALLTQVAGALDVAHERGLVHRDIKPANVLVEPPTSSLGEHAYLSDFGLTKRPESMSGLTKTGQFLGSVEYAAPEQFEGKPLGPWTDVYSIGGVAYEALTGEVPYPKDLEAAVMHAHLHEPPPRVTARRPGLPAGLDAAVATAMAKRPEDRYETAGAFAQALAAGARGEMVAGRPSRRRRALVAVGGLVFLTLALVIAALLLGGNGKGGRTQSPPGSGRVPGVLRIDPTSARIVATVDLQPEHASNAVALGDGFLWVLERAGVRKVNEAGTVVGERIAVGTALGCPGLGGLGCVASIAAGEGSAWVAATPTTQANLGAPNSFLAKIDPLTNRIETFRLPSIAPGGAFAWLPLATGEGWVWTIDRNPPALVRIDPADPRQKERFQLSAPGDGVGIGFGSVWVRHNTGIESLLSRVDPVTGRVLETISVPGSADGFAFGGGSVWVSDSTNDELVEIDPTTNSIVDHFPVGTDPRAVAVDDAGDVWVDLTGERAGGGTGVLVKVDPTTGEVVTRIPLGGSGGVAGVPTSRTGLVFGFGSVWVA